MELSVGGLPQRVSAGGVMSLHPDAPFRVLGVRSDAWLDIGLKVYLAGLPEVDLNRFHTLAELLGDKVYTQGEVDLVAHKSGRDLGSVRLAVRLMPIDWLRKAEAAEGLEDKIAYTAKALELTPDDRLLLMRLVDLMVEARRYREAVELLEQQPGHLDDSALLSRLAELYQRLGQGFQEAQVLKRLLEKSPQDASLIDRLASVNEELERWEEAALYLEALSQVQPEAERGATWRRLGLALLKTDKKREAAQTLERAAKARPFDPETWQVLAEARAAAGDSAGALEAQRRVASLAPGDQDAQLRLAQSLLEAGKKREAAAEMEKAAALRPDEPALWLRLARLHEELSDRPAQLKAYRQLARLSPKDPDVQFNLAVLLLDQKQPEAALAALEAAAQARPKDADIQGLTLDTLVRLGRWEQVTTTALAMIKERPGDASLALKLYPQLAKQRPQGAAALLEAALAGGAKDQRLYQLQAALALDQDDTGRAIKALEAEALALPANLEIKLRLAGLYESAGQDEKARQAYEEVLDKDPAFEGAQERYLQFKTRLLDSKERGKEPAASAKHPPAK
jgi:predicted Zn-dependent protease